MQLVEFHKQSHARLTIATYNKHVKIDLGVIQTNETNEIIGYIEKPEFDYKVSMGVYVYEPEVLKLIRRAEYLDFPTLVLNLLQRGERVISYPWNGLWLDIGRPDDYAEAQRLVAEKPEVFGLG